MKVHRVLMAIGMVAISLTTGCATSQNVNLAPFSGGRVVKTVVMTPSDGNSADMDAAIRAALVSQGLTPKPPLPAGTRRSPDADVLLSYVDQWRWDVVMYLRWVTIDMYDAESGNLLATGRWDNSALHGFQDYKSVVKGLIDDMMTKIRARTTAQPDSKPAQSRSS